MASKRKRTDKDEPDLSRDGEFMDCRASLKLKPDHQIRPIYVTPDFRIFLETFSPIYKRMIFSSPLRSP